MQRNIRSDYPPFCLRRRTRIRRVGDLATRGAQVSSVNRCACWIGGRTLNTSRVDGRNFKKPRAGREVFYGERQHARIVDLDGLLQRLRTGAVADSKSRKARDGSPVGIQRWRNPR